MDLEQKLNMLPFCNRNIIWFSKLFMLFTRYFFNEMTWIIRFHYHYCFQCVFIIFHDLGFLVRLNNDGTSMTFQDAFRRNDGTFHASMSQLFFGYDMRFQNSMNRFKNGMIPWLNLSVFQNPIIQFHNSIIPWLNNCFEHDICFQKRSDSTVKKANPWGELPGKRGEFQLQ